MNLSIPKYMKACVLTAPDKFEIQDDVPVPVPGPEEVLCKIGGVAICGSDPGVFDGHLAGEWPPSYPFIAGHEWAGRVVALGEGVTDFRIGDRVAGQAHKGCGYCRMCLEGRYTLCMNYGSAESGHRHYGFITPGAYAQYCVFHIKSLTHLADTISYKEAAMCDTGGVALHGIEIANIVPGCTVAVIGPGPIGIMAMKLARACGAARVIMVGRGSRLMSSIQMGCHETVDFTKCDPVEAVRSMTNGTGVDVCFECSGANGTISQAVRMCRKGGKAILLGVPSIEHDEPIPFKYIVHNEILLSGSRANPNVSWKFLNLIEQSNIDVRDMVTHTFPLDKMQDAMDVFVGRKDNVMKVVIYPNEGEDA